MRFFTRLLTGLLLAVVLCQAAPLLAQEEHIETDRDSFTRSPRIVPLGMAVVEGSYSFLEQGADSDGHLFPDLLVRYGLSEWIELRLGWNYEIGKWRQLAPAGSENTQEGIVIYGAKLALTEAQGWLPDSSLVVAGYTPTSGESNDSDFSLEFAAGWEWGESWELDGGLRWFSLTEENDHYTEWAPSVVLKKQLCGTNWNAHVEYFSLLSTGRENDYQQHYFGPGVHYLITPNMEIGTRVFWGLGDDSANFICNVGLGVRF